MFSVWPRVMAVGGGTKNFERTFCPPFPPPPPVAPPEITVEKSWVHASEGYDTEVCCTVHGDTNSDMLWYQNSFLLDATERRSMDRKGDKYCLRIRNFQVSDFGNYSCVADNALGRTKKYIEVSGSPGPATFLSPAYSGYLDLYNLTWTIESIPPLEEIRLLYRRLMVSGGGIEEGEAIDCHPLANQ